MIKLLQNGGYLINQDTLLPDGPQAVSQLAAMGHTADPAADSRGSMAWGILQAHNTSGDAQKLRIKFDQLTSHDITYVGIIQTARASGLERFAVPYVLTNCHNSLCAVGGTINEDDHLFGLTAAKRYGGVYVPPHQAVIHQYAREMMAACGQMILGSDSHTRYGALGTMAVGEGGPELVKQLLGRTYDIDMPGVVGVYLHGSVQPGVGPQDVALALIGAVFESGFVNNRVLEFVGPGIAGLSADFRIGVDVMTTETTCLSSIWRTDETIREFYAIHGREQAFKAMQPANVTYYSRVVDIDLSAIKPMIALPFHPSNTFTIEQLNHDADDILADCERRAADLLGGKVAFTLRDKVVNGRLQVDQGIIAGCAGGVYENICHAADYLNGQSIGTGAFNLSVYPASNPIMMQLVQNGVAAQLLAAGAVIKTAFCGPCFGAGDTPANNTLSIRHSTRNFPNREGSKLQSGQIASVALMDARSIAATAANGGILTPADQVAVQHPNRPYFFNQQIYKNRVFDSHGVADTQQALRFGPNIRDWPEMPQLTEHLLLRVVSEIHDPVTTTDELIPSGETSSYRSNPEALAEFALSRKDPAYVGLAKQMRECRIAAQNGQNPAEGFEELAQALQAAQALCPNVQQIGIGSTIFAQKPGDGSAREQAASCQRVLGGWANIAFSYATKRYRSNLINWGMLPFTVQEGELPFGRLDFILVPNVRQAVEQGQSKITAYNLSRGNAPFTLELGNLTADEREILLRGCLINYYQQ